MAINATAATSIKAVLADGIAFASNGATRVQQSPRTDFAHMTPFPCSTSSEHGLVLAPFFSTASSPRSTAAAVTAPMSPTALHASLAAAKQRRSLWRCQRRRLTIQDLLSTSDVPPAHQTQRTTKASPRRQCAITECTKYAVSGGFCIGHGGGKRCQQDGCTTVAQSGRLCKAHGGGSKCRAQGCGNVARRHGLCTAHGGRETCKFAGCDKCAHGGGLCISHGGGKRCASQPCPKSAQSGGFCYSHGGGKRCTAPECFQAARKGGRCTRHRYEA